jgi:hypothetical protein
MLAHFANSGWAALQNRVFPVPVKEQDDAIPSTCDMLIRNSVQNIGNTSAAVLLAFSPRGTTGHDLREVDNPTREEMLMVLGKRMISAKPNDLKQFLRMMTSVSIAKTTAAQPTNAQYKSWKKCRRTTRHRSSSCRVTTHPPGTHNLGNAVVLEIARRRPFVPFAEFSGSDCDSEDSLGLD